MGGFPSPFSNDDDGGLFDEYDEFVPDHLPTPGEFLEGHRILEDEDHVEFHETTRELFEERKVYDMTFNYNLARLNLDTRHESAGYRYAEELDGTADEDDGDAEDEDDTSVLRAEFTPTTPFCPQSHTLTIGSFRAWNGLRDRHEYDVVKVRVKRMHHQSEAINDQLRDLEREFLETGTVPDATEDDIGSNPMERSMRNEGSGRGPQAPF